MVVQHNINAMTAYNKLNANVTGLKKSSEKLASGYRINRAGDDAAGLAVSEKMRSQIKGLKQAVRNAQDGINMIQTFEGAATNEHEILQRMKVLAEESANGTYDNETDRDAIQLEFQQLNKELDQLADTDFNGRIALNGGRMADGTVANGGLSKLPYVGETSAVEDTNPINYTDATYSLTYKDDKTVDTFTFANQKLSITASQGDSKFTLDAQDIYVDGMKFQNAGGEAFETNYLTGEISSQAAAVALTQTAGDGIQIDWSEAKINTFSATGMETEVQMIGKFAVNGKDWYIDADSKVYSSDGRKVYADGATFAAAEMTHSGFDVTAFDITVPTESANGREHTAGEALVTANLAIDKLAGYDSYAKANKNADVNVSIANAYDNARRNLTYADSVTLQLGPRSKDATEFTFEYSCKSLGDLEADLDISSRGLGTNQLSLTTPTQANYAIDQIDNAINKVSMVRATFGAMQNRLEYKIDNMTTTQTNLQEAESNIRDTDMADEMMNYTKFNILQQAAQSMLAQANQQPQSVLQLLG